VIVLNPRLVEIGGVSYDGVRSVSIDRRARRTVLEWSDNGPQAVMGDAPERVVEIRVSREVTRDDALSLEPGTEVEVVLHASVTSSQSGLRRVRVERAMVEGVRYQVGGRGATQTIELVALSSDGSEDPVEVDSLLSVAT
jgi:hypothetical protein